MAETTKTIQTNFYPILVFIRSIHNYMDQYGFVYNYNLNQNIDINMLRISDNNYYQFKAGSISFTSSSVYIYDQSGWGFHYVILGY